MTRTKGKDQELTAVRRTHCQFRVTAFYLHENWAKFFAAHSRLDEAAARPLRRLRIRISEQVGDSGLVDLVES